MNFKIINKYLIFFLFLCPLNFFPTNIEASSNKLWSILICTIPARKHLFNRIYDLLQNQINTLSLQDEIEVLYFSDDQTYTVGYKRNKLLEQSSGKYVCFIDDDDMVSDDYIKIIYEKLLKDPDCVSLQGDLFLNGKRLGIFIHSLQYDSIYTSGGVRYRPPNHLNPIRRAIAIQFKFPDANQGEDGDWAMQLVRSKMLKKEEVVSKTYYIYFLTSEGVSMSPCGKIKK